MDRVTIGLYEKKKSRHKIFSNSKFDQIPNLILNIERKAWNDLAFYNIFILWKSTSSKLLPKCLDAQMSANFLAASTRVPDKLSGFLRKVYSICTINV